MAGDRSYKSPLSKSPRGRARGIVVTNNRADDREWSLYLNIPEPKQLLDFVVSLPGWAIVMTSVAVAYLLINLILPHLFNEFIATYIIQPLLWCLILTITLLIVRHRGEEKLHFKSPTLKIGFLVGGLQVAAFGIAGLLWGFDKNPHNFGAYGIFMNLGFVVSVLLGMEFSRAYLVNSFSKNHKFRTLLMIALLYTIVSLPLFKLTSVVFSSQGIPFLSAMVLPLIAQNLLACLLAFIGGPLTALAYMGTVTALEWFFPLSPDLPWIVIVFVGTLAPIAGLAVVQSRTNPQFEATIRRFRRRVSVEKIAVAIICVMIIWASLEYSGHHFMLVQEQSIATSIAQGDIVMISETSPDSISEGDIILSKDGTANVLHRVVEIKNQEGSPIYITRGNDKSISDSDYVHYNRVVGKVAFTIPKIGWGTMRIKNVLS